MRYNLIIKKIRTAKHVTLEDINDYLEEESSLQGYDFTISSRTFARDVEDIGAIYGIYIKYDRSGKFYFIEEEFEPELNDRLLEAFDMYHALKIQEQQWPYIHLEKRRPQGTEHLYDLLPAIKKRRHITFSYQKYYRDSPESRTVAPLVLKEFKNRWYLFAKDTHDGKVKCYAVDRMSELETLKNRFVADEQFDVDAQLKYCFGIMAPNADEPTEIILSFEPLQGKYVKSLPLHDTQEIINDTADELRIRLTLYLTHDFLMELLSYGDTVRVVKPRRLVSELKNIYTQALEQYGSRQPG